MRALVEAEWKEEWTRARGRATWPRRGGRGPEKREKLVPVFDQLERSRSSAVHVSLPPAAVVHGAHTLVASIKSALGGVEGNPPVAVAVRQVG